MTNPNRRFPVLAILFTAFALLLSGCHSSKSGVVTEISDASSAQLFKQLVDDYASYHDVYMPVTLNLQEPTNISISGRATIVRDSLIHLSLRMLGMEVGLVYIDTREIWVVDKFHKLYFNESLDKLLRGVPLTVGNMQDLILGRAFLPGSGTLTNADAADFKLFGGKEALTLIPLTNQLKDGEWHYTATKTEPPLLASVVLALASGTKIEGSYTKPVKSPAGIISSTMRMNAPVKDKQIDFSLQWNVSDAKWNGNRTVSFNPPGSNYKRIALESLMKSLNNL